MFWTQRTNHFGDITLCEPCALIATNDGSREVGLHFDSMLEAAMVIEMMFAMVGVHAERFSTSEFGLCAECGAHKEEATA